MSVLKATLRRNAREIVGVIAFVIGVLIARHNGGSDVESAIFGGIIVLIVRS